MFSTGDAARCPVMLFRTYIAHRPPQLSNTGPFYLSVIEKPTATVWYKSIPLGKNSIANIMKKMKLDSPLSIRCPGKRITNHSARKQVVKKLKSAGIPKCEIKNITGHSTEKGLDDYDSGDEKEQRLLSNIIDGHSKATSRQGAENVIPFQIENPVRHEQQSSARTIPQSSEIRRVSASFSGQSNESFLQGFSAQPSSNALSVPRSVLGRINVNGSDPYRQPAYNFNKCNVTINVNNSVSSKPDSKPRKRVRIIE